ncbi:histone-lysine N-methyltransferase SETDB2 [Anguilla anguilla]|uniref:histone-lysine N-methyltransferase SETDB2 n=1 Tax=Anguilla anguilla TaxID=7936 RepID=UPI0015B21495|nr:histone-lysine N-methyltransferase SETDB2 [Anguilla anguilla]
MENIMPSEIEKAKEFWRNVDVSFIFGALCDRLQYLRDRIEAERASDREFIVGMNIILASELYISPKAETDSDEESLLYGDVLPVAVTDGDPVEWKVEGEVSQGSSRNSSPFSPDAPVSPSQPEGDDLSLPPSPLQFESSELLPSPPENQDLLAPLSPSHTEGEGPRTPPSPAQTGRGSPMAPLCLLQPVFQPHSCSWICLPLPSLSAYQHLRGRNPLKVPLIWGFQRLHAAPPGQGAESGGPVVFYKAPCGRSLRGPGEVLRYLRETEADAQLHLGNFSFSAAVLLQRRVPPPGGARELLDADISRGAEPVAVQLWNAVDEGRPARFRYRSQCWLRGCLPGAGPVYASCCDCADGCADPRTCACLQLSLRPAPNAQLYRFRRLPRPLPSGLYECGPWCGCDRARCQNRVVQHGLQVRLQVFRSQDRGWGVRCIDDLDAGTFVCTYTGVVLRAGPDSGTSRLSAVTSDPSPLKRKREEQSSDDEVEVVEEWRVPAVESGSPPNPEPPNPSPASPPVHVSVIKTPAGPLAAADGEQEPQSGGVERGTSPFSVSHPLLLLPQTNTDAENGKWEGKEAEPGLNSEWAWLGEGGDGEEGHTGADEEHLYYLDATEEGNVGRFLNHSCCPNLFVQNVFIDSHHRDFPTVAFFTSRAVTAGTELTWNYSYDPGSVPEQEVPCQCGCESCQGTLI